MRRKSAAVRGTGKLGQNRYRIGQFVITRVGSRWRVGARPSSLKKHFATLGGAVAWCQQQYDAQPTRTKNPPHA